MDLRQLRYFVAVAEDLHFSRAAQRLHVAQSAVSHTIKLLERELGVTLLDRMPRGVALTAAGELFLSEARAVLARAEQAAQAVARIRSGRTGVLRIAVPAGAGGGTLAQALTRAVGRFLARAEHRHVQVQVRETSPGDLADAVREGRADVAVLACPVPADLAGAELDAEALVAVLPADDPLAAGTRVGVADLVGADLAVSHAVALALGPDLPADAGDPGDLARLRRAAASLSVCDPLVALSLVTAGQAVAVLRTTVVEALAAAPGPLADGLVVRRPLAGDTVLRTVLAHLPRPAPLVRAFVAPADEGGRLPAVAVRPSGTVTALPPPTWGW